jgi:hypothetical protein
MNYSVESMEPSISLIVRCSALASSGVALKARVKLLPVNAFQCFADGSRLETQLGLRHGKNNTSTYRHLLHESESLRPGDLEMILIRPSSRGQSETGPYDCRLPKGGVESGYLT